MTFHENLRIPRLSISISLILNLAMALCASNGFAAQPTTPNMQKFDPVPWQQDFTQLLSAMADHYANLEWAMKGRHMDLVKLREETQVKLNHAHNDTEARAIFEHFLAAFGDGHLGIEWPKTVAATAHHENQPQNLCQHLGYSSRDNHSGLDFSSLPQFTPIAGDEAAFFPGGLLLISGHRKIGVIRIGLFSENGFPQACEQVVMSLGLSDNTSCDSTK